MDSTSISPVSASTTTANQVDRKIQGYSGKLAKAKSIKWELEQVKYIRGVSDQTNTLSNIAFEIAKAGLEKNQLSELYEKALGIAHALSDRYQGLAFRNIASAMAEAGLFKKALEVAQTIYGIEKADALTNTASAMAKAGVNKSEVGIVFEKALEAVRDYNHSCYVSPSSSLSVEEGENIASTYLNIASAMAEAGLFKRALEVTKSMLWGKYQESAVANITSATNKARLKKAR